MCDRLLRLLRFLAAVIGLSLGASPGPAGAVVSPVLFLAPPPSPHLLCPPPRRRRQIATGQLGQANGLRPAGG